ncbi:hypothetical protein IV203_009602 [Nitzschia inconspicua]|uniref:Uncharacterized protein n=1 Tax=Nitzschia inconspicua TaxID=303405 RepID=A0A9K3KV75_9STRA|nr:hypothetical protein IV203_009602 [Nitzschia inconspicua]
MQKTVAQECSLYIEQYFEGKPFEGFTLDDFKSETGLLAGLQKKNISIPQNPSKPNLNIPSLLLYDLKNDDHKTTNAYKFIDESKGFCSGLYGTSGAGKTRSVYEYLSHNFGFYFLANASKDPGSGDLVNVLGWFETKNAVLGDESFQYDLDSQSQDPDEKKEKLRSARLDKSTNHYLVMDRYIMIMIYVRVVIFTSINKQLTERKQHQLTPYDWLLIQLFPKQALKSDLFARVCAKALTWAKDRPLDSSVREYMTDHFFEDWPWSVMVVDEAQALLNRLDLFFLDGKGNKKRTAFSAVLKSMTKLLSETLGVETGYPLVAGTGMSLEAIRDASNSIMAKDPHEYLNRQTIYKSFDLLDAKAVEMYLLTFLRLELQETAQEGGRTSDALVIEHVAKWLRGRPRWAASFLELYLVREPASDHVGTQGSLSDAGRLLMQALDRFIDNYTNDEIVEIRDSSGERRKSFDPPEGTAYSGIKKVVTNGEYRLVKNLESAIFKFAIGGKPVIIEEDCAELVEVGVAALSKVGSKALLDEPIIVQAGINYFSLSRAVLDNIMVQEKGGLGEAFEKVLIPAIQRKFQNVLKEQLGTSGDILTENYTVPYRSAYGVLGVSCETPAQTMQWIYDSTVSTFEGQVPPFCFPDVYIGPDLIFLLWNDTHTDYIAVISQIKYKKGLKQLDALRTITPSLLYHDNRGKGSQRYSGVITSDDDLKRRWEDVKPRLVGRDGSQYGCVRFMIQYPCDSTRSANPGVLEDDEVKVAEKKRPKKKRKLGFLVCISKENARTLFDKDGLNVLNALKDLES